MGSLHKNIQLMLEFLKALFLVLYFPPLFLSELPDYVICVMLLSLLMTLLPTLSVIRHLV